MSDQTPEAADASASPGASGTADECTTCLSARGILFALAFAAFAAYVAADFATGGRLTAAALGAMAAVRGRAGEGSQDER